MISLPDSNIRILEPVSELSFFDTQSIEVAREISPLEAWNIIMSQPQPLLRLAFQVRDTVSSCFGVRKIGGFSGRQTQQVVSGDTLDFLLVELDFLLVENVDTQTLVLPERDRHLDVMTCISTGEHSVAVTSSVRVHNLFGTLYMIPVGIAHKWIVRGMLKHLRQTLAA